MSAKSDRSTSLFRKHWFRETILTIAVTTHETHPSWFAIERHEDREVTVALFIISLILRVDMWCMLTYVILLIKAQTAPTKVRNAINRSLGFPGVHGLFLYE